MPKYTVNEVEKQSRCGSFFYNKTNGTVLGRSPLDWLRLLAYYTVFYGVLVAFFFGQLSIVMNYVVKTDKPYRTGEDSLLELTPGLSPWPKLEPSSASIFSSTNKSSDLYQTYIKTRKEALIKHSNESTKSFIDCDFKNNKKSIDDVQKSCKFDNNLLGKCSDPEAEMNRGNVCVYWKINKIFGYIPDIKNNSFADTILLKCQGQYPPDVENLGEPVYYPSIKAADGKFYGKFSHAYFPYVNQQHYQDPLVAVTFPNMRKNIAILVKCTLDNLKKESSIGKIDILVTEK